MHVALVEPYLGGSHRAWAEGYAAHSSHAVDVVGLPAIHWKWRMQGAHVTLASRLAELGRPIDVVLAGDMVDVAGLIGLARASIGDAPVVTYFHENQLTFPLSDHDRPDLTYAMTNWTSMVASDLVVFNSQYHLEAWFDALPGFLARLPDQRHTALVAAVRDRSTVLPIGIDLAAIDAVPPSRGERPVVLWNQRWEYDKGPDEFAAALLALADDDVEFEVVLAGPQFDERPPAFGRLVERLGDRVAHAGEAAPDEYRSFLRRADVVVSTARHEFFGIAVVEAIAAGAFPVLPDRLVYPERIPASHHDHCLYRDDRHLVERLRWAIEHREDAARIAGELRSAMTTFDWRPVAARYDAVLEQVAAGQLPQRDWPNR